MAGSGIRAGCKTVMWLDRRTDPNNHDITTFQATSTNDGRTWRNFQIGAALWNPDQGFFTSGAFIGDYSGLAASTTAVYPAWTDGTRNAIEIARMICEISIA